MNNHTPTTITAVADAESVRVRQVRLVAWFVFLMLGIAAILASCVQAQVPKKTPAKAGATAGKAAGKAGEPKAKPAPVRPKPVVPAGAFKYDVIELPAVYLKPENIKLMQAAAKKVMNDRTLPVGNELEFAKRYFQGYAPAKMTQPDALAEISPLSNELLQFLTRAQKGPTPGAQEILKWLFTSMRPVAEGNYQPAARINATLILGRLDLRAGSGDAPPVPLKQCFPILLSLYQDPKNPDGVRAAALQGLHRSVMYGFPQLTPAERDPLIAEMKKLLADPAPTDRSPKAHAFVQRYAVDILEMLAPAGDTTLATQLVSLSTSPDQPDLIALYSAARLGSMKSLQATVPAPETVLKSWSLRALHAYEAELARLNALTRPPVATEQPPEPDAQIQKKAAANASMGMGMGMGGEMGMGSGDMTGMGYGPEMGDMGMSMEMGGMETGMGYGMGMGMGMGAAPVNPQPPEVIISRRNLNHVLEQLKRGVTGVATGVAKTPSGLLAAAGDDKAKMTAVESWITAIDEIVSATNVDSLDDRTKYIAGLEEQIIILKGLAGVAVEAEEKGADVTMPALPDFLGQ